jgi:3-methyladenine DNA glycosylase AlkC
MAMPKRKGAARRSEIPPDVLADLNAGRIETASLPEALAVDFAVLMAAVAPELADGASARLSPEIGFLKRTQIAGQMLAKGYGVRGYSRFAKHPSDTVRGWAAFMLSNLPKLSLADRLKRVRVLADDSHFGVRESAWLGLRPHFSADLEASIDLLSAWTSEESANLRRFAVEGLRPRGVWCAHLELLKQEPERGLPLLEPLRSDPAKYVQDSVANWLNDASKTQPAWVKRLCQRWRKESKTAATERICRRATRSLT